MNVNLQEALDGCLTEAHEALGGARARMIDGEESALHDRATDFDVMAFTAEMSGQAGGGEPSGRLAEARAICDEHAELADELASALYGAESRADVADRDMPGLVHAVASEYQGRYFAKYGDAIRLLGRIAEALDCIAFLARKMGPVEVEDSFASEVTGDIARAVAKRDAAGVERVCDGLDAAAGGDGFDPSAYGEAA